MIETSKPALRTCAANCGRPLRLWKMSADGRLWHPACLPVGTPLQTVLSPAAAARRIAALEAALEQSRLERLQEPSLRHCLRPGCLREFDAMATMSGRTPERPSWSGEGWLQMRGVVGYICPEHAHLVANDAHRPKWERPNGDTAPAVLRCACDWTSPPSLWVGYGTAAWQNHLLSLETP